MTNAPCKQSAQTAWCYGTGGEWRARVRPIVTAVCDVEWP